MKNTIKLAILFLVLIILVILLPSKKEEKTKKEKLTEQIISLPDPILEKITVYSKNGVIKIYKENNEYKIEGIKYKVGAQEFSIFLGEINSIEGYKVKEIKNIKEEKPLIEAYLKNNTQKYVKIIGKSEFGKPSYYIKNENGFYQVETEKIDKILDINITKLRDHSITNFISDEIKEFSIDKIRFYKDEEKKWKIKDFKEELDENKVFGAFAMATGLRAKSFTGEDNVKKYNLDKPIHTLIINKEDGTKIKIIFTKKENSYYGYSENIGEIFEIYKTDWDILEKGMDYYKKDKEENKG